MMLLTTSNKSLKDSKLHNSTKFSQIISNIHLKGLGCKKIYKLSITGYQIILTLTELRSNEAPPFTRIRNS